MILLDLPVLCVIMSSGKGTCTPQSRSITAELENKSLSPLPKECDAAHDSGLEVPEPNPWLKIKEDRIEPVERVNRDLK